MHQCNKTDFLSEGEGDVKVLLVSSEMFEKLLLGQRRPIGPSEGGGVVSRVVGLIPAAQLQGQTSADTNRPADVFISLRHSTPSLRKGDRRINKKTSVILLSSSNSSHSPPLSLSHSAPLSLSFLNLLLLETKSS